MRNETSRRTILGTVAGALGTVAGGGFNIEASDHSEQGDSVARVSNEGDGSPRWLSARHRRHADGYLYGMTGSGKTTRVTSAFVRRIEAAGYFTDPAGNAANGPE
jgi:hypothetical protein